MLHKLKTINQFELMEKDRGLCQGKSEIFGCIAFLNNSYRRLGNKFGTTK